MFFRSILVFMSFGTGYAGFFILSGFNTKASCLGRLVVRQTLEQQVFKPRIIKV